MSSPQGVFGLEVPPGGVLIPASLDLPATIHISMAAIDPTEEAEADEEGNTPSVGRSTLRVVRRPVEFFGDDEDDSDDEDEYLHNLLAGSDDSDDDDEPNGGPSDQSKARSKKSLRALLAAAAEEEDDEDEDEDEEDEEMEDAPAAKANGTKTKAKANGVSKTSKKGKEPATVKDLEDDKEKDDEEEDDEDEDEDDEDDLVLEDFVLCTLDTERLYQQPLEITIDAGETVFFTVSGTHSVHLTGNYIVEDDEDDSDEEDSDEEDYDLPPDADLDELDSDELDELDALTDRVEEIEDEDDEAPQLAEVKKKGKKRPAEDDAEQTLDDLISKEGKDSETKLSKKQQKKLKTNQGEAVGVQKPAEKDAKEKKVQFAKNLEQGPTGPAAAKETKAKDGKAKQALGVKVVQGVTIDDRKLGSGRVVKSGDRVGMRYIGKLENGKVFDSNKKGAPFSFRVGKGEVIRGWDIGIVGMSIGGERRLTIPASLAYGSKKLDGIPANSTLIFDVKLLEIK